MKKIHVLFGNSEGLLNDLMEVLVQQACGQKVASTCTRTIEDLIRQGASGKFDLVIIVPNNLIPPSPCGSGYDAFAEAAQAIQTMKERHAIPVLALAAFNKQGEQHRLRKTGADLLITLPFQASDFLGAVAALLGISQRQTASCMADSPGSAGWGKGIAGGLRRLLPRRLADA